MARRAKFGRRPAVQASIAGTLIAIAREMQAKQDQNIMDAWKNGGQFEGKPVTDERAMAYWKARLAGLDKSDPYYDTYKNQIMQLDYAIQQDKQDLLYTQGKITDQQYAQFLLNWSKKVPKESAFWRSLQKDAAKLIENGKEKARINAEKAKQESFNRFVEGKNKELGVGVAITDAINQLSQATGLSVTGNGERLLELLTEDYKENPGKYHALADAIKAAGVNFSGVFTDAFVSQAVSDAAGAFDSIATRAKKDGYTSVYTSAAKGQSDMTGWASNMNVWPVSEAYDKAYKQFQSIYGDPSVSWKDKMAAATAFSETVTKLSKTPGIDNATQTMLQADAARLLGQDAGDSPSFGQAMLGHPGVTPDIAATVATQTALQVAMDTTPGAYTYAPVDDKGQFDPTGKGAIGIVPTGSVPAGSQMVAVPGLDGKPQMVAIQPTTVYADDPNDGTKQQTPIGKYISYQVGGRTIQMWGYKDSNGQEQWSSRSPYAEGTTSKINDDNSITISMPQTDPTTRAAQIDAMLKKQGVDINISESLKLAGAGGSASVVGFKRDDKGRVIDRVNVSFDPQGGFKVSQTTINRDEFGRESDGNTISIPIAVNSAGDLAAAALAPGRLSGAKLAGTSETPLGLSVTTAAMTMSGSQMEALAHDPAFQHAFLEQAKASFGTDNPLDPRVVDAWNRTTSPRYASWAAADAELVARGASGKERDDLLFPGMKPMDAATVQGSITFAGKELKVPALPAYLAGTPSQNINLNPISAALGLNSQFGTQVLQPGQQPGQQVVSPTSGAVVTVKPPAVGTTKPPAATTTTPPVTTTKPPATTTPKPAATPAPGTHWQPGYSPTNG